RRGSRGGGRRAGLSGGAGPPGSGPVPRLHPALERAPGRRADSRAQRATDLQGGRPDPQGWDGGRYRRGRRGDSLMSPGDRLVLQQAIDDLAHALQTAIGLSTDVRRDTQETANDAVLLEPAIGRAVSALSRLQPAGKGGPS